MGAGSEAPATTTIEWPMAPCSSSWATIWATVDSFCPMATYMQMRSCPFWLMIVSTAIAVLPVWRSPRISSRWPRPIGIMESMALIPVWTGVSTGWRTMTPGAIRSTGRNWLVSMGPLPSSGLPSGSTTRPMSASPTGTWTTRPVVLTWSPSLRPV